MRRMPPDFGCCANAGVAASANAATARPMSLVFILSLPVTRFGSPTAPLLLLEGHANRCGRCGQPGRRVKGCGVTTPGHSGMAAFRRCGLPSLALSAHHWARKQAGSAVSESSIVAETAARIFADLADPQEVNRAKDGAWKAPLWQALAESGLTLAWVPEENGGAGAELADGFAILGVAGRYAVAVPLAETLLAGWLLSRASLKAPEGAMSVAPARPSDKITLNADGTLSGQARGVPFAKEAKHLAVLARSSVALVGTKACGGGGGANPGGEPQNTVTFDKVRPLAAGKAD